MLRPHPEPAITELDVICGQPAADLLADAARAAVERLADQPLSCTPPRVRPELLALFYPQAVADRLGALCGYRWLRGSDPTQVEAYDCDFAHDVRVLPLLVQHKRDGSIGVTARGQRTIEAMARNNWHLLGSGSDWRLFPDEPEQNEQSRQLAFREMPAGTRAAVTVFVGLELKKLIDFSVSFDVHAFVAHGISRDRRRLLFDPDRYELLHSYSTDVVEARDSDGEPDSYAADPVALERDEAL